MSDLTRFKNVSDIKDFGPSDTLEMSLHGWLQWGFLGVGAFANVQAHASGAYGGDLSRLRLSEDRNYAAGRVWEGFRKEWVWESGVGYPVQPIHVSGVYVNGVFHATAASGAYAHHVDYPNGRIVFDSGIATDAVVTAEYSYRYVQVATADAPWWREVQANSLRADDPQFLQTGSGAWAVPPERRLQMPAVVVEATTQLSQRPFEIGDTSSIVKQTVLFHILAETPADRKKIFDVLVTQNDKRIAALDFNRLAADERFPLDENGSPAASGLMYPALVQSSGEGGYYWRQIRFLSATGVGQVSDLPPYSATVAGVFEMDLP